MTKEQIDKVAHRMAFKAAESALYSFCVKEDGYYNTADFLSGTGHWVAQAVRYLDARGKLLRKPGRRMLVKVRSAR
jgi:hypothetical protein